MRQAVRLARAVLVTGVAPSEWVRLTKLEQEAFIAVANVTAQRMR